MLTFLALNAGATFVAWRLALGAGAGGRSSRLALCILSGYLAVIHTAVLLAGLLGWLTSAGLAVLVAGATVGAWWFTRGGDRHDASGADRSHDTPATLFAPLVAAVTAVAWTWPHVFEATRLWVWDDYTYHMVYPALWLREHAIGAVTPAHTFTMQAWYAMSAGVVATWFMVPFGGSRGESLAWVSLTAPLYAGIAASAMAELLARRGSRAGAWAVPVVLFMTSSRIAVMASSFSDADLAVAAALLGALAFAMPGRGAEHRDTVDADAWYASVLTGFALGIKPSAAPYAVVVFLAMVMRAQPRAPWRAAARSRSGGASRRSPGWRATGSSSEIVPAKPALDRARSPIALSPVSRVALAFAASWAVMAGYWYARNLVHTGNPVYPAAFAAWPGTTFPRTTLREYAGYYGVARAVRDALAVYTNWPPYHAALAVAGLVGLTGRLVTARASPRADRSFGVIALSIVSVMLLTLPVTPYSAGNALTFASGFIHWDSMRYIGLLPMLGWVALGCLLDAGAGSGAWRTGAAIALTSGAVLTGLPWRAAIAILSVGMVGAVLIVRIRPWVDVPRLAGRLGRRAAITGVVGAAAVLIAFHGAKAAATAAALHREPLFGAAAVVLDGLPAGTRVAVFGDQWIYPAFGDRDHLVPVRLDGDGRILDAPIGDAMAPGPLTVDPWRFGENLAASGVDVVAVVHLPHPGRSPEWPAQHRALETIGARLLHRRVGVEIWRLGDASGRRL